MDARQLGAASQCWRVLMLSVAAAWKDNAVQCGADACVVWLESRDMWAVLYMIRDMDAGILKCKFFIDVLECFGLVPFTFHDLAGRSMFWWKASCKPCFFSPSKIIPAFLLAVFLKRHILAQSCKFQKTSEFSTLSAFLLLRLERLLHYDARIRGSKASCSHHFIPNVPCHGWYIWYTKHQPRRPGGGR